MALSDKEKKVHAALILEIIGRPPEHLVQTLNEIINLMGSEPKIKVLSKKIAPPVEMKEAEEFFATHAEVEIEAEEIMYLVMVVFKYMPAYVEIISPETISLTKNNWGEILSEITRRLHRYDEIARILQNERAILEKKLKEVMQIKEESKELKKSKIKKSPEKTKESLKKPLKKSPKKKKESKKEKKKK